MQFGILATNHGKHSDAKLAVAVAEDIVHIGATATGQDAIDGRKLVNQITDIMEAKFRQLAEFEHAQIAALGTEHLAASLDAHPEIFAAAVSEITDAIARSPFAHWFTSDQVDAYVQASLTKWLKVAHHMHRDYYANHGLMGHGVALYASANHDPDCPHVKRWKAMHAGDVQAIHEHRAALADKAA